jgi:PadR family transcriptional regulator, regulatory protein PadR
MTARSKITAKVNSELVPAAGFVPRKLFRWALVADGDCFPLDNQEERSIFLLTLKRRGLMADTPGDVVQGTLDMLILKTVALEPMHGYGIAVRIEQMSKGVFRVNAGSLFVAFQRLQRAELIKSEWKATENGRRAKYYALTELGRKKLDSETREWGRQVAAIARILEA